MKAIAPVAIALGFLLVVVSLIWPMLFPATRTWTDEKSRRLKELSAKAQYAMGKLEMAQSKPSMSSGENPAILKRKADEMKKELKVLQEEFTSAKESPQTMSTIFKWSGIGVMLAGIVGYVATKDA